MDLSTKSSSVINPNLQKDQQNQDIINYLEQLTPLQKMAYEIAKDHLKTSFDITRSNGFNEWLSLQHK
jgi:hypothetical protein